MAKKVKKSSTPQAVEKATSGKKGKKGKKEEVVDVKETKEEIKAKHQANRTKVTSIASWTGKLPLTLFHEFCQKKKWNKVEYDMKNIGDKGLIATATISCTDPKTKEVLRIRMNDPTYDKSKNKGILKPEETPMEARHMAATIGLYRIAFNTNLHMMLPPNHKKLWYELDDYRKEILKSSPERAKRVFDSEPFASMLEERRMEKQREKEREAKNNQTQKVENTPVIISSTKDTTSSESRKYIKRVSKASPDRKQEKSLVKFPRKVWENATFVDLQESSRQLIEKSIKYNINWSLRKKKLDGSNEEVETRDKLKSKLLFLKFREPHVLEAMEYSDPLSFLLFNLPEDDLPPFFRKRSEDSSNKVEISLLPLVTRLKVERLTECGISNDEAIFALQESDMDEAEAASYITQNFQPALVYSSTFEITEEESIELWNEEAESLKSIYEDRVEIITPSSCFMLSLNDKLKVKLKVYRSTSYPYTIPGIIISTFDKKFKLPDYIKKQVLDKLLNYVKNSNLLGDMLIYTLLEWLDDNLEKIIDNPGPLLTDFDLSKSSQVSLVSMNNQSKSKVIQKKRGNHSSKLTPDMLNKLKHEYDERVQTMEYKAMQNIRSSLPAWGKQEKIVELVDNHDVVLVTGETGSGKSTQVVQFLLDSIMRKNKATNILCTQPRRISAIGLAERVSDERCTQCGDEVGYLIRGVNKTSQNTRIKFMTTGVLVRILQSDKSFLNDSIIVIDEVHERSIDTDLIVTLLKNLLDKVSNLKIVLMSATVNIDLFRSFFPKLGTIHIEGRTFPIKDFYLDDILESIDFKIKRNDRYYDEEDVDEDGGKGFLKPGADSRFFRSGQINYELLADVTFHVDGQLTSEGNDGSIIIFLPGVAEISKCCRIISEKDTSKSFVVLPLHSALTPDDQKRVFRRYGSKRKIVVSTNIAETSITIDDCVATIDTGRAKTMYYSPKDNTSRLIESFISKAESKQRRGRAGRVRDGLSYKLFSKQVYEEMVSMPAPEIKRIALESLYLSVKAMGIKNVTKFLAGGLEAPPLEALGKAERLLLTVGLLNEEDKSLTELGQFISLIPVMDIKYGKLLVYCIIFGVTDLGILAASILSEGILPFIGGMENRDKIKNILSRYKAKGDLLASIEIMQQYLDCQDSKSRHKFIKDNLLSYNKVQNILSARDQFFSTLRDVGFLPMNYKSGLKNGFNRNTGNFKILMAILTGAFYPNVSRVQLPDPKYFATSAGAIEKDPEAKQIKYWIRNEQYIDEIRNLRENDNTEKKELDSLPLPATRAFIHPSSVLFSSNTLSGAEIKELTDVDGPVDKHDSINPIMKYPFAIFNTIQVTSKLFLRDITPTTTLSLLLFGGPIRYDVNGDAHSPGIVVDDWLPIRTWCKNAVLIKELRVLLDHAIKRELENPRYIKSKKSDNISNSETSNPILTVVENIIQSD